MMTLDMRPFFARPVVAMGASPDNASLWVQVVPFVIILGIFYFIILLPMRKKQQKVQEFLDALKVNDRIVTTGGIFGTVTRLDDKRVQIQIADKVRIDVARASIGGYQGQEPVQEPAGARDD
jgi:preprotein translocase subunit YajC